MHRAVPHSLRAATAVAVAAGSLLVIPLGAPAPAAVAAQCTSVAAPAPFVVGGVRTRRAELGGCTPSSVTGGSGTSVTNLGTLISTTTWAGGRGTTIVRVIYTAGPVANRCPAGTHLTISGGKVIGGSGAASSAIKVGSTVSARWCVTTKFAVTLEPGSVQTFDAPAPANPNAPPPPVPLHAGLSECPANTSSAVTALANQDRRRVAKAVPLTESANLNWAARKHAIAMAVKGYSFHDGWDTEIRDSGFRVGPPGWTGQNVGWMIAPFDPKLIEAGYFDEKPPEDGHRLNILNRSYHYVGIGCVIKKSNGAIFTAEDFGS